MRRRLRPLLLLCWALQAGAAASDEPEAVVPGADPAASGTGREGVAGEAAPIGLEALMGRFAASAGVRARFRETKYLALLAAPLETEGLLYFAQPDRLARTITRPGSSRIVVVGDEVALQDETGYQRVSLAADELARYLVDNLLVLLRGDLSGLRERYSVAFRSDASGWQLTLEPRAREVRRVIEAIHFSGRGAVLDRIETRETGGDRTVTLLEDVEPDHRFEPAELARIFSLDGGDGAP